MNNRDIENKLKTAMDHSVPDVLENILSGCDGQNGKLIQMADRKKKRWMPLSSVAAVLILVMGSIYGMNWSTNRAVDSVIGFDVNPGVELQINKKERVLAAAAVNEDGKGILDGMDLKNTDLDVAVNALIGSMLKNGYIDDLANSILVTVDNEDADRGQELQKRLVTEINQILSASSIDAAILSQNLASDAQLKKLATDYGISEGKASLIQNMIHQNSLWKFEDLAGISINELNLMAESHRTELKNIKSEGRASDKAFIGEAKAKQIALSHAGLSESAVSGIRIEFDWDDGRAEYEVEFYRGNVEYDYDIDALTGEIRGYDRDTDDDMPVSGQRQTEAGAGGQNGGSAAGGTTGGGSTAYIGEARAKAAALAHAGLSSSQVTFYKVKLDSDDGRVIYEVEFYSGNTEYDYDIDALTGKVLSFDREVEDRDIPSGNAGGGSNAGGAGTGSGTGNGGSGSTQATYIGETKAKNIALAKVPGASVKSVELDDDDGRMIYEVELRNGNTEHDFKIDALTGDVLKWESEEED